MTKRLVIAAVLLLLSFSVSFFSVNYVVITIENTLEIMESTTDDLICAEKITALWQKNKRAFALFLKHADADSIERLFIELDGAVRLDDSAMVSEILYSLRAYLSVTAEGEKIKTENIF